MPHHVFVWVDVMLFGACFVLNIAAGLSAKIV
jgi:hypothetical protein